MNKIWLYVLLVAMCILQVMSIVKIIELENELVDVGNYLSEKIDNETSKVNEILTKMGE